MAPVYSLMYVSEASGDFQPLTGVDDIVATSVAWNGAVGITGVIIYSGWHFAQYLEGRQSDVDFLLAKIRADPRHHSLHVVYSSLKTERLFPDWSLAYAGDAGFVRNKLSSLFSAAQRDSVAKAASNEMIELMREFIALRDRLGPSLH